MASHKEILRASCDRLWRLLDKLNESPDNPANNPKDAEQYHQILSALADSVGLKMAEQAEEERENGAAYRGASYGPGREWAGHWDPYLYGGIAYRNGPSYGPDDWTTMDNPHMAGRAQPRDSMGRWTGNNANGGGTRRGAYGDGMVARLESLMAQAPAADRRHFEKVLEHVEKMG